MKYWFTHLLAVALGAAAAHGIRQLILPHKQADGIAKVANQIDPGLKLTGDQVQSVNAELTGAAVSQAGSAILKAELTGGMQ